MIPPPEPRARHAPRAQADLVVRALRALGDEALDPALPTAHAREALALALAPLTAEALLQEAARLPDPLPGVVLVVARGPFTSPLEWLALYATLGLRVHLKLPRDAAGPGTAFARAFAQQGLPVTASTDRDLSGFPAIVAMGGDQTAEELRRAWPLARLLAFGHRVSAAWVQIPEDAEERRILARALAWDHLLYDTSGCMAPVAVFAAGDREALAGDLDRALRDAPWPRAPLDPRLGPAWRERLGLARARGRAFVGDEHAVLLLPAEALPERALPRMACLLPADPAALARLPLSSLAVAGPPPPVLAPRVCAPGRLQTPEFPRRHDGVDMLDGVRPLAGAP